MELLLASILFLIGLGLIVKGGDLFVDAAVWMARASGMPQFLIGATIVSLATTMPELVVSSLAALHGNMEMAIGNAVGSVTANTGLILGLSVVMLPIAIVRRHFLFKGLLLVLSCAVLTWFCRTAVSRCRRPASCWRSLCCSSPRTFSTPVQAQVHKQSPSGCTRHAAKLPAICFSFWSEPSLWLSAPVCWWIMVNCWPLRWAFPPESLPSHWWPSALLCQSWSPLSRLWSNARGPCRSETFWGPISSTSQSFFPCVPFCPRTHFQSQLPAVCWTLPIMLLEAGIAVIPTIFLKKFTRLQGLCMVVLYCCYLTYSIAM